MGSHNFREVDVFGAEAYLGNPLAVVLGADGVADEAMRLVARWMNLSETTFLVEPVDSRADYAVRIFTPDQELPFAGHPTLGSAHAWLEAGNIPKDPIQIIQECAIGLVALRHTENGLAFAAPPLRRSGPADDATRASAIAALGVDPSKVVDVEWVDNGPGWLGVLVDDADTVLALRPGAMEGPIGVVGPHAPGSATDVEVRAFLPIDGTIVEDPVTGSLNASLGVWLLDSGRIAAPYVASQGTAIGRAGRIFVERDDDGTTWIAGATRTIVKGTLEAPPRTD
jgi:PhzF family phenazine biosynthesis protein